MKATNIITTFATATVLATGIGLSSATASDRGIILDEATDDYASETYAGPEVSRGNGPWGYTVETDLEESWFDYDSSDVAAYHARPGELEQAEIAAFEFHEGAPLELPADLVPQD